MKYEEVMEELYVYVIHCTEGIASFSYHVAARSREAAICLVRETRPRVHIKKSRPEPLFKVTGFPSIRIMEPL